MILLLFVSTVMAGVLSIIYPWCYGHVRSACDQNAPEMKGARQ